MASEKSARREPCLMFERNHFIPKGALRQRTEVPRRYNITSQGLLEPVNRSPSACSEISQDVCDSRNATRASKDPRSLRCRRTSETKPTRLDPRKKAARRLKTIASRILKPS